jgi:hypothetical protein
MDFERKILEQVLALYEESGPEKYLLGHRLSALRSREKGVLVSIQKLLAKNVLLAGQEQETKAITIALNPAWVDQVRAQLAEPRRSKERESLWSKVLLLVLVVGLGLAGLWAFSSLSSRILWFVFCLVCYPVVLAFTHGNSRLTDQDLVEIYKRGLRQLPVVGRLLARSPSGAGQQDRKS